MYESLFKYLCIYKNIEQQHFILMLGVQSEQLKKQNRFYLRFHNSISRAIELNQQIFGDSLGKDGKQPRFQHSLRVAGFTQQILDQTMDQYHKCWILGILHDNKQQNPLLFSQKIDYVLKDLFPKQQQDLKRYIDILTSDKTLSKGQQKLLQIKRVQQMELIPSYILLFDKYDNCRRFKVNSCGKTQEELNGYYSVAYLIYLRAKSRHKAISQFMPVPIRDFYQELGKELGGQNKAIPMAQKYCQKY